MLDDADVRGLGRRSGKIGEIDRRSANLPNLGRVGEVYREDAVVEVLKFPEIIKRNIVGAAH